MTRILVQGDSITWGQGVRDWTDLYPARLLDSLDQTGRYDMAVYGMSGFEIQNHFETLKSLGATLSPDIIIYQWYVNDIVVRDLPAFPTRVWQQTRFHPVMMDASYLYFVLDKRLDDWLPGGVNAEYSRYLREDFDPNSSNWVAFRVMFHQWATLANHQANRTVMFLYPQVPFRGAYPMRRLHERMREIAGTSLLTYPVSTAPGQVGADFVDPTASSGLIRRAALGQAGVLASGPSILLRRGPHEAIFRLRLRGQPTGHVVTLEIAAGETSSQLASVDLGADAFPRAGGWRSFAVPFEIADPLAEEVQFRVIVTGAAEIEADTISLPTSYDIDVIDPTRRLNEFDTHASSFDAHPNERAHAEIAQVLFQHLTRPRSNDSAESDR